MGDAALAEPAAHTRQATLERTLARWLGVAALALGVLYAAFFAYHAFLTMAFPYDLDWGEGYVLNDALRLARGEQIYGDIQHFPMVRSPYPPLFLLLDIRLMQVTGPSFLAGRLLSLFATIACCLFTWRLARNHGADPLPAAVAGLFVVASPFVYQWAPYSRVDMLALAWGLLALVLASGGDGPRRLALAGLAGAAALLTKQTALAAPLAVALALLLSRPRLLLPYLLGLLVPLGIAGAALVAWSQGGFITHVILGNAGNPTNLARLIVFQVQFALLHPVLLAAIFVYGVAELRTRHPSVLALAGLLAWLVSLSVANETSSVNYLLEPAAVGAAVGAVVWTRLAHAGRRTLLVAALAALQLLLVFHVPNVIGVWPLYFAPHGYTPTDGDWQVGQELDALVQATPGPILSEPAGFAARNGREVLVQPLDLRAEQYHGRWDSTELRQALRERRYGLVILSYGLFPDDVLAELRRAYALERTLHSPNGMTYRVYRPAP